MCRVEALTSSGKEIDSRYYLRGGVSYPKPDVHRSRILPGYITLVGYDIDKDENVLLLEQEYRTTKELLNFFEKYLDKYSLLCYYTGESENIRKRYETEFRREARNYGMKKVPYFVPINISTGRESMQIIWDMMLNHKLLFEKGSFFDRGMKQYSINPSGNISAILLSVLSILRGNIMFPYKKVEFKT